MYRPFLTRRTVVYLSLLTLFGLIELSAVAKEDFAGHKQSAQKNESTNVQSSSQPKKQILLIAGPITGHPKNTHEYEKSVTLLKHLLDNSDQLKNVETKVVFEGWPKQADLLKSADTIVLISDGGDHKETNHPLYVGDRFEQLKTEMDRGCGFVQLHWSTFNPSRFHDSITEWLGGYFDYEKGPAKNGWFSKIQHYQNETTFGAPSHPICNGVKPPRIHEEFYYKMRFRKDDQRLKRILNSKPPGEKESFTVGWAVERKNGGRGFGFTGGHYYKNWWNANFRKLIVNAIVWSAGIEIPETGIETQLGDPIKTLIITGDNHPAHIWRETTAALLQVIEQDPRVFVDVQESPEFLAGKELHQYDSVVMNYANWTQAGLSEKAKSNFSKFVKNGGGVSIIHFANGAFNSTLPKKGSEWKEYRTKIVNRAWMHGQGRSGHDAFGAFRVEMTEEKHPITAGLKSFETIDELYYRQEGELDAKPIAAARSKDTGELEPMAWAYRYEKGKIFQTVLGHADKSVRMAGALIRRGNCWTVGMDNLSFDPPVELTANHVWRSQAQWTLPQSLQRAKKGDVKNGETPNQNQNVSKRRVNLSPTSPGKFGKALDARGGGAWVAANSKFQSPEFSVSLWAKLNSKKSFNILIASELKSSATHWELYTHAGKGTYSVYMPGLGGDFDSKVDVCDGKWHFLGFHYAKDYIELFVDGKSVRRSKISKRNSEPTQAGLTLGALVSDSIGCDGQIDDVVIQNGKTDLTLVPTASATPDSKTIAIWNFDKLSKNHVFPDSANENDAALPTQESKPVPNLPANQNSAKKNPKDDSQEKPEENKQAKVSGHWGEDALGFRWTEDDSVDGRWQKTEIGPFLASTFPVPGGFAKKGLAIRAGKKSNATFCYDLERLSLAAVWTGEFVKIHPARFGLIRHIQPGGPIALHTGNTQGWQCKKRKYLGKYQNGNRVTLKYQVGDTVVHESPTFLTQKSVQNFVRSFHMSSSKIDHVLNLAKFQTVKNLKTDGPNQLSFTAENTHFRFALFMKNRESKTKLGTSHLKYTNGQIQLSLPSGKERSFSVVISRSKTQGGLVENAIGSDWITNSIGDLAKQISPGPRNWDTLESSGVLSKDAGAYVVDKIGLPFGNKYKALFFVTGHDFLANGDMVVSTVHGDVWLAKFRDTEWKKIEWHRFATGLYQPLGIRVIQDKIYVLGRDEITCLHDRDGNSEADFYECFNNDGITSTGVHDYATCLETDGNGNFYYVRANTGLIKVSPDGKQHELIATGFRNPNGLGVRKDGLVTVAPQEGEWTPASCICDARPGQHYGYPGPKITAERPTGVDKPMINMPRLVDNSSGGQVWVDSDLWGPLKGQMIHFSYGKCKMFVALREEIEGVSHGGVAEFPFEFESGVSRGKFSPIDGQLYVSGLKGWVTSAAKDGFIARIRYTQKPVNLPVQFHAVSNGLILKFSEPLTKGSAEDIQSYVLQRWNYKYSSQYGSPEYRVSNPKKLGRDDVRVESATLMNDQKSVFLEIDDFKKVDQFLVEYQLTSQKGVRFSNSLYLTINAISDRRIEPNRSSTRNQLGMLDPQIESDLSQGLNVTFRNLDSKKESPIYLAKKPITERSRMAAIFVPAGEPPTYGIHHDSFSMDFSGYYRGKRRHPKRLCVETNGIAKIYVNGKKVAAEGKKTGSIDRQFFEKTEFYRGYNSLKIELQFSTKEPKYFRFLEQVGPYLIEPISAKQLVCSPPDGNFINGNNRLLALHQRVEKGCVNCHLLDQVKPFKLNFGPNLLGIAGRRSEAWLANWISDPAHFRKESSMPKLLNPTDPKFDAKVGHLTAFLASLKETDGSPRAALDAEKKKSLKGVQLYEQLGCIACHYFDDSNDELGNRISLIHIDQKYPKGQLAKFLLDPSRFHPQTKMPTYEISQQDSEKLEGYLMERANEFTKTGWKEFKIGDAKLGQQLFVKLGCVNCHVIPKIEAEKEFKRFGELDFESAASCLNSYTNSKLKGPSYHLSSQSQISLRSDSKEIGNAFAVDRELATIQYQVQRCGACHDRDGKGSMLTDALFDEGELGTAPEFLPDLTEAGEKLHTEWLSARLSGKAQPSRPWLKTKMPKFHGDHGRFVRGLSHQHGYPESKLENASTSAIGSNEAAREIGKVLIEQNRGHDCRQCHGIDELPPRGDDKTKIALGIHFDQVPLRIRKRYYDRWMLDPLRIDPLSKMPRYSTDGRTTKIQSLFEGDAKLQFDAIWQHLLHHSADE